MTDMQANRDRYSDPATDPGVLAGLARDLATGAAEVVRAAVGAGNAASAVSAKSTATDLVTEVDRASESWLVEQLCATRPDDAILGEEGGEREGRSAVRWVLDPIDGTVNFVLGLPQYAVSVAAEVDGVVVAGAVCNPASGEVFHARLGGGAYLGSTRLDGPRDVLLERAVIGTGFAYDAATRTRQVGVVAELLPRVADVRRLGAAALDLCFVAAGRLDGYFEAGLNLWDHAAGGLIAAEAGCQVSGLRGRAPSTRLCTAAGPALAADLFPLLESLGADEVFG
jgi:myo-inositol-1(or 4)-monophosphatase